MQESGLPPKSPEYRRVRVLTTPRIASLSLPGLSDDAIEPTPARIATTLAAKAGVPTCEAALPRLLAPCSSSSTSAFAPFAFGGTVPPVGRWVEGIPATGGMVKAGPSSTVAEIVVVVVDVVDHTAGGASLVVVASCGVEYDTLWHAAE